MLKLALAAASFLGSTHCPVMWSLSAVALPLPLELHWKSTGNTSP